MNTTQIYNVVHKVLEDYCLENNIELTIDQNTPLIGSSSALNSLALVSIIVDVETAFLDEDIEITLTSESAMSSRISPFRSVGSLCGFIAKQLQINE